MRPALHGESLRGLNYTPQSSRALRQIEACYQAALDGSPSARQRAAYACFLARHGCPHAAIDLFWELIDTLQISDADSVSQVIDGLVRLEGCLPAAQEETPSDHAPVEDWLVDETLTQDMETPESDGPQNLDYHSHAVRPNRQIARSLLELARQQHRPAAALPCLRRALVHFEQSLALSDLGATSSGP